jgi:hypothetical protein
MDQFQSYLNQAWDFAHQGFMGVNGVIGLLIAVIAVFLMSSYNRILIMTAGATIAQLILDRLLPVLNRTGTLRLPDILSSVFWRYVALLLVGYFIVISVLYIIKKFFLRAGH